METSKEEQRQAFVHDHESGQWSMTELCQRYGITRPSGYLWVARYKEEGEAGLVERFRTARDCPQPPGSAKRSPRRSGPPPSEPGERYNRFWSENKQGQGGRSHLEQYAAQAGKGAVQRQGPQTSEEERERLRRLGYVVNWGTAVSGALR